MAGVFYFYFFNLFFYLQISVCRWKKKNSLIVKLWDLRTKVNVCQSTWENTHSSLSVGSTTYCASDLKLRKKGNIPEQENVSLQRERVSLSLKYWKEQLWKVINIDWNTCSHSWSPGRQQSYYYCKIITRKSEFYNISEEQMLFLFSFSFLLGYPVILKATTSD